MPGLAPGTLVEVKGTLRCEEPLASEMAEKRCAYYSSKVIREYTEGGGIGGPPPGEERHRFVVSHRSEESLGQNLGKTVLWLGVGGIAALVMGAVLLVVGIVALLG